MAVKGLSLTIDSSYGIVLFTSRKLLRLLISIVPIKLDKVEIEHWEKVPNNNGYQLFRDGKATCRQESIYPGVGH